MTLTDHTSDALISRHYQSGIADLDGLLAGLDRMLDTLPQPLTAASLAAFDQFHIGGLAATAELVRRVAPAANARVLDAGSGLGGPSRFLAAHHGCDVTGIDLAPAYVAIAQHLAERTQLSAHVRYAVGNIASLPFPDGSFDLVWSQHVVMNVADRDSLYAEFRRVLRPGGIFAFYDPFRPARAEPPHYPVPWAETPQTSTLLTEDETVASLQRAGLKLLEWDDVTPLGLQWMAAQPQPGQGAIAPNLGMILGPRIGEMVMNFGRNLREGRVCLVMGMARAE